MSGKIIPAILACIVLGFILGIIPFVSENLHWNLYYFIPVSSLISGGALGYLCFWICFNLNERVRTSSIVILAIAAAAGYATVDYGTYHSVVVRLWSLANFEASDSSGVNYTPRRPRMDTRGHI